MYFISRSINCWGVEVSKNYHYVYWEDCSEYHEQKKKTTASVINQIKQKHSLEILTTSKLKYCGHIMCISHSMEKDLMLGLTDGYRRGKQHTRWTDKIQGTLMMNWCGILTAMQNRFTRQWKTGNDKTNNRQQDPVILLTKTQ